MRKIEKIYKAMPTIEGAGVHLKRGFDNSEVQKFDPFLLFDDFSNTNPESYEAGFPKHPHRGIETVTYILKGEVRHKDSLGNEGSIKEGEVQWMTAGSGILHEEMPMVQDEGIQGFQLWVNIPAEHKMMAPRYQEIKSTEIPCIEEEGKKVRVIAGTYEGVVGPVQDLLVSPTYLDITLDGITSFSYPTPQEDTFFVYVFGGRIMLRDPHDRSEFWVKEGELALLTRDALYTCTSGNEGSRFLLIGGKPLNESICWAGPIVMNTEKELQEAFRELQEGTFIKK